MPNLSHIDATWLGCMSTHKRIAHNCCLLPGQRDSCEKRMVPCSCALLCRGIKHLVKVRHDDHLPEQPFELDALPIRLARCQGPLLVHEAH